MKPCLLCSAPSQSPICQTCEQLLPLNEHACQRCGIPLSNHDNSLEQPISERICESCFHNPPPFLSCFSPFLYQFPIDQMIHAMKYAARPQLARLLAEMMLKQACPKPLPAALIPVPMHGSKQRARGYNQALYLAQQLGKQLKLPVLDQAILKTHATAPQNSLSAKERKKNLNNAFTINPRYQHQLSQLRHIAIVDDVITTTATVTAVSQCLQALNIEQIDIWSIARTP